MAYFGKDGRRRPMSLPAFRATTLDDPETTRKPNPTKDAVVRVKQIAAFEPAEIPVLSVARRRLFAHSSEHIFLPDQEYMYLDDAPVRLRMPANIPSSGTGNA